MLLGRKAGKGKRREEVTVSTVWVVGAKMPEGARGVTDDILFHKSCDTASTNKVRNITLNLPAALVGVLAASPPLHR